MLLFLQFLKLVKTSWLFIKCLWFYFYIWLIIIKMKLKKPYKNCKLLTFYCELLNSVKTFHLDIFNMNKNYCEKVSFALIYLK